MVDGVRWNIFYLCVIMLASTHAQVKVSIQEFQNKLVHARQQLTNFYEHSRDKAHVSVESALWWNQSLSGLYPRTEEPRGNVGFMWAHNNTLMSLGLDLWVLKKGSLVKTASLDLQSPHTIRFVKSAEWKERLFFLACFDDNKCTLSTSFHEYDFHYCHTISDNFGAPVAAEFFSQGVDLFLVVLFQPEHSTISKTKLYKWQKTHMAPQDIPETIRTASTVTVFGYKESAIFVFGSTGGDRTKNYPSQVWRRSLDGVITKVQYLPIRSLLSQTHFVDRGENFLLALEENKGTLYWWKGDEFIRWLPVEKALTHLSVSVSRYPVSPTLLTFYHNNHLKIYVMTYGTLQKVYELEFNNEILIGSPSIYYEGQNIYMVIHYKYNEKSYLNLYQLNINISYNESEQASIKENTKNKAQEVIEDVSDGVEALKLQLVKLNSILDNLLLTNKDITMSSTVNLVSESMDIQSGDIVNLTNINQPRIAMSKQYLNYKINLIRDEINLYFNSLKSFKINPNRHLVIMRDVHFKKAKINSLVADVVNEVQFDPSALLSCRNSNQRLPNVKAKNMSVNWLLVKHIGASKVEDLFKDYWNIKEAVHTRFLQSRNLHLSNDSTINKIKVKDLMEKQVSIFTSEQAQHIIPQVDADEISTLQLQDNTIIENLNVDKIDNALINDLLVSLFVKHKINKIHGNLHFNKGLRMNKFEGTLRYLPLENPPDKSNLYLPPHIYYVSNWGVQNRTQQNPHNMYYMFPPGIRRTRSDDSMKVMKQIRTIKNKVKILGNLKVQRLVFQNSSLHINDHEIPSRKLDKVFWTYSSPQVIHNAVNFSQGVELLNGLESPIVNGLNLSHYATRDSTFRQIGFQNVHIEGDIVLKQGNSTNQYQKNTQEFNVLKIKHLQTDHINGKYMKNCLKLEDLLLGRLNIVAANLSVKGNLEASLINNMNVTEKFQKAIYIDEDSSILDIVFEDLSATEAGVEILNGFPAGDLLNLTSSGKNSNVKLKGDFHIAKLSDVKYVNNKTANLSLVVNRSQQNTIAGKKHFLGQVASINNIEIRNMNGVNTKYMFDNLLRTSGDQLITGFYTIRSANFGSLSGVTKLNGINVTRLLYTDQSQITIQGDINLKNILVQGATITSSLLDDCVLPEVGQSLLFTNSASWTSLSVEGGCSWKLPSKIQHLLDSTVTTETNQTISGNISVSHLFSKTIQVHSLNEKNITFIFQDSLYRNKDNQVVSGKKTFLGPVICENINVRGDARFTSVNKVNINEVDSKLVRHKVDDDASSRPVSGHKRFMSGFKCFILTCLGGINGIPASSLAQERLNQTLPPLIINFLDVMDNMQLEYINGIHLKEFFKDCVNKSDSTIQYLSDGLQINGNVILQGSVTTPSINNISSSDLVYTTVGKRQINIQGCQTFTSNVSIETNSNINTLNGKNLTKSYLGNVKIYENSTINGTLVFMSEVELDTIYAQKYLVSKRRLTNLEKIIDP